MTEARRVPPVETHKSGEPFSVRPDVLKSLKLEVTPVSYHKLAHYIEVTGRISKPGNRRSYPSPDQREGG